MNIETELSVPDIVCGKCAGAIKKAFGDKSNIAQVDVNIAAKTVRILHDGKVKREEIISTLDRAGFSSF